MSIHVLGIDPGFATFGIARVDVDPEHGDTLLAMRVLTTKASDKKRKTLAMDENLRRLNELVDQLVPDLQWADVVCMESFSPPRHASAAAKIAFVWGAVVALCRTLGKPVLQASPQRIKSETCGDRKASKDQVQHAIEKVFGEANVLTCLEDNNIVLSRQEHCYDAAAAIIACLDSETVKLLATGARRGATDERTTGNSDTSNQLRLRSQADEPRSKVRARSRSPRRG